MLEAVYQLKLSYTPYPGTT